MKHAWRALLLLVLIAGIPLGCGGGTAGTGGVPLSGRLVQLDGTPIVEASVSIEPGGILTITDSNGEFFSEVISGREYTVSVGKPGEVNASGVFAAPNAQPGEIIAAVLEARDDSELGISVSVQPETPQASTSPSPTPSPFSSPTSTPAAATPTVIPTAFSTGTPTPVIATAIPIPTESPIPTASAIPEPG